MLEPDLWEQASPGSQAPATTAWTSSLWGEQVSRAGQAAEEQARHGQQDQCVVKTNQGWPRQPQSPADLEEGSCPRGQQSQYAASPRLPEASSGSPDPPGGEPNLKPQPQWLNRRRCCFPTKLHWTRRGSVPAGATTGQSTSVWHQPSPSAQAPGHWQWSALRLSALLP